MEPTATLPADRRSALIEIVVELPDNMKYQQAVIFTPELNCGTVL
jgi:hypothetical protein